MHLRKIADKDYSCKVCGSSTFSFLFKGHDRVYGIEGFFDLFRCADCGLVFVYPVPGDLEMYYPEDYYAFKVKIPSFSRRIIDGLKQAILETYSGPPRTGAKTLFLRIILYPFYAKNLHYPVSRNKEKQRVLDVGCGTGQMLTGLKNLGWEVYGNDISASACKAARDRGLKNIKTGFFNELDYPSDYFDSVCMSDVLEHMEDPLASVRQAYETLKSHGEIIIALPNYNSLGRRIFGKHDVIFDLPRHLFMFTPSNLSLLLEKAGFVVKEVYTTSTISSLTHNLAYMLGIDLPKVQRFDKVMNLLDMIVECILPATKGFGNRLVVKCKKR